MKNVFTHSLAAAAFALSASAAQAAPETYGFDPYHTTVTWTAGHFGFSNPSGKFMKVDGKLVLDEAKPDASSVDVTISPASISTGIEKFDTHLKSADFFNVEKFPSATFKSTKVEVTGKDTAKVTGNLTLLGVTKPVTLDVKLNKLGEQPMSKVKTAGFTATGVVKRSEFGINYALPNVTDEVKILIEAEAPLAASK